MPTIGRRTMLVNARKILRPGDHDGSILLAIEALANDSIKVPIFEYIA
jgi:hypothetical protein